MTKQANIDKWTAALRSGNYSRAKGHLRTKDGFCCLGVACDVYAKETGKGKWEEKGKGKKWGKIPFTRFVSGRSTACHFLPNDVMDWLGLDRSSFVIDDLVKMNDADGANFEDIANAIETMTQSRRA